MGTVLRSLGNWDAAAAREYHNRTKHSPRSVHEHRHYLDWKNEPLLFKLYPDLEPVPLPIETGRATRAAFDAISGSAASPKPAPDLKDLASLLYFSCGITRRRRYAGGEVLYRAASNTGALYEIELYVACGRIDGLEAGVYHFGPRDNSLRRLHGGDFRGVLARAAAQEEAVAEAPAIIVSTGTYWRNAWKYQARTYRHFGWDNGTIHANMFAMAAALDLPARLVCGFADDDVNRLLALDPMREVSLMLVPLGHGAPAPPPREVPPLDLRTVPISKREVDYPIMREAHAASSLANPDEVVRWRTSRVPALAPGEPASEAVRLESLPEDRLPRDTIEEVILRRGSSRRFERKPIALADLSVLLDGASAPMNADFLAPGARLNEMYVIAHAVDGLRSGAYYFDVAARALQPLKHGDFRDAAAFLGLEQRLAGDAAVAVFFVADLGRILARLGNRGYRAVQLEAGLIGGRLYLGAYALGLGATGLTFYDDEVTGFFSPHAAGKSAIFLVAVGHPAART